jgi:hypothetical protein
MTTLNYRSELSYNKTELKQFGEYVAPNRTSGIRPIKSYERQYSGDRCGNATRIFPLSIRRVYGYNRKQGLY